MANCCFTTYKITGTKKAIMNLDQTLESMNVSTEDVLLADLADRYGIDYLNRRIAVRGHIFIAVNESNADKNYYMLSIETETAGAGCHLSSMPSRRYWTMNCASVTGKSNPVATDSGYMMRTSSLKKSVVCLLRANRLRNGWMNRWKRFMKPLNFGALKWVSNEVIEAKRK